MALDPYIALGDHTRGLDRPAHHRDLDVRPASPAYLGSLARQPQDLLSQNRRQAVFFVLKYKSSEWVIEPVVGRNPGYPSVAGTA